MIAELGFRAAAMAHEVSTVGGIVTYRPPAGYWPTGETTARAPSPPRRT
ncbi:hypothetical protein HBB16_00670 [Pseudonocardia sp. MCCB 268]|nr:hypothetical protein [Pseudonocardia cytotoxica]